MYGAALLVRFGRGFAVDQAVAQRLAGVANLVALPQNLQRKNAPPKTKGGLRPARVALVPCHHALERQVAKL
jgi:hypothetical protein